MVISTAGDWTPAAGGSHREGPPRVLVTRPAAQAEGVCRDLAAAGLQGVCLPLVVTRPSAATDTLDAALQGLSRYQWIVFTSANAVRYLAQRAGALGVDLRAAGARVCAGPATATVLAGYGRETDLVLDPFSAARAAAALATHVRDEDRILLPRAEAGPDTLAPALRRSGAMVDEVALYRTEPDAEGALAAWRRLGTGEFEALALFSPSAVQALRGAAPLAGLSEAEQRTIMGRVVVACIGGTTAGAVEGAGWRPGVVAPATTAGALASALAGYLGSAALPATQGAGGTGRGMVGASCDDHREM